MHTIILAGISDGRPLVRPRQRWEDNIKMDFKKAGCDVGDCVDLAQH